MTILKGVFVILLLWGIYHSRALLPANNTNPPDPNCDININIDNHNHQDMLTSTAAAAGPKIYDALIIGGGPAGMSAALALARVCRTSILFDSGEYRNQGAPEMHTFLSRDGIPPEQFRATARQQIQDK
jgi:hypothetical protein